MKKQIRDRFQTANTHLVLAKDFQTKIDNLLRSVTRLTNEHREKLAEWREAKEYHLEEHRRYNLQGLVCGREYTAIRIH